MRWITFNSSIVKWVQLFNLDRFIQLHREDKVVLRNIKVISRIMGILVVIQVNFSLEMVFHLRKTVINISYQTLKTLIITTTMELVRILILQIHKLHTLLISSSSLHRRLSKTVHFIRYNNIEGNLNKHSSLKSLKLQLFIKLSHILKDLLLWKLFCFLLWFKM